MCTHTSEDLQGMIPRLLGIGFEYKVVSSGQHLDNKSVALPGINKSWLALRLGGFLAALWLDHVGPIR